ncbi:hypothetical protein AWENTII_004526 [Aspergillus wentii]
MTSPDLDLDPIQGQSQGQGQQQQIPNPQRLLILSPTSHSHSTIPPLLHSLTGVPVTNPPTATSSSSSTEAQPTFAGYTTHPPLRLSTKYYKTDLPIWVDEIPLENEATPTPTSGQTQEGLASPTQWKTEFSGAEARVVRDALGGIMIVVRNPESTTNTNEEEKDIAHRDDVAGIKDLVKAIGDVKELIEEERGGMGEVASLLVLVGRDDASEDKNKKGITEEEEEGLGLDEGGEEPFSVAWWEDQLYEIGVMGFEVVRWDPKGVEDERRNRYGEYQGMRRIKEVLETHDWTASEDPDVGNLDDDLERHLLGLDDDDTGFGLEVNELEREMVGLRMAIERGGGDGGSSDEDEDEDDGDDEIKVESMEALMLRMQAIKGMSLIQIEAVC